MPAADTREFQLVAGHPALDLINTLDWRFRESGPEELLGNYGDLLRFLMQSKLIPAKQARELLRIPEESGSVEVLASSHALREAASSVIYASVDGKAPEAEAIALLDAMFKESRRHQYLVWDRTCRSCHWSMSGLDRDPEPNQSPNPALPLWILSSAVSSLVLSPELQRIRACENPECRWLFLDTSKNHTRRWCDMRLCGNRMKARRFKAHHRA